MLTLQIMLTKVPELAASQAVSIVDASFDPMRALEICNCLEMAAKCSNQTIVHMRHRKGMETHPGVISTSVMKLLGVHNLLHVMRDVKFHERIVTGNPMDEEKVRNELIHQLRAYSKTELDSNVSLQKQTDNKQYELCTVLIDLIQWAVCFYEQAQKPVKPIDIKQLLDQKNETSNEKKGNKQ